MNSSVFYCSLYYLRAIHRVGSKFTGTKLSLTYNSDICKGVSPFFMSSLQSKFKEPSMSIEQSEHSKQKKKDRRPAFENTLRKKSFRPDPDPEDSDIQFGIFINSAKSDPDSFGTLNEDWKMHQRLSMMPEEKDDVIETEFLNNREGKRRLTVNQYGKMIKKFLKQKKVRCDN